MADQSRAGEVSARYGLALFELADGAGAMEAVDADLGSLRTMLAESGDLSRLVASPRYGREAQAAGLEALAERAGFTPLTRKLLGLLAANRRLAALPGVIAEFRRRARERRGIVEAEVVTAQPLSESQSQALAAALRSALGKAPEIHARVDAALLGGMRVRVGSRLYDASLKGRLDAMRHALQRA